VVRQLLLFWGLWLFPFGMLVPELGELWVMAWLLIKGARPTGAPSIASASGVH
jgi:hypothetical protein